MLTLMLANVDYTELIAIGIILISSLIGSVFKKPKPGQAGRAGRPRGRSVPPGQRPRSERPQPPVPPRPQPGRERPQTVSLPTAGPAAEPEPVPIDRVEPEPARARPVEPPARRVPRPPTRVAPTMTSAEPLNAVPDVAPPAPRLPGRSARVAPMARVARLARVSAWAPPKPGPDLRRALGMVHNKRDLRAAFILSEILAPPVACRDNPHV